MSLHRRNRTINATASVAKGVLEGDWTNHGGVLWHLALSLENGS